MPDDVRIELSLRELRQLFHSLDPSPFYDRDLDDDAAATVEQAVHAHFSRVAEHRHTTLRRLFARGRASLGIGLLFLAAMLLIAGWVAMWRPMEIFLYDWWPIRADIKLYRRLAAMPAEIVGRR